MFGLFKKKRFRKKLDLDASIAFLDSKNLPEFDSDKFEGVLEQPLSKKNFIGIFVVFLIISFVFLIKTFNMQIINGEEYFKKAQGNFIKTAILFSERGVVSDRNGKELIWNERNINDRFAKRRYIEDVGFSHILGFLSYPQKDKSNNFFEKEYKGKAGVEKYFNDKLNGVLGKRILETSATGEVISENVIQLSQAGENVALSIDADIQKEMAELLNDFINEKNFDGASGVLMSVENGEIISLVSLPEYDSNILTDGRDKKKIKEYIFDEKKPFLNRVTLGEFAPGSVVKPFIALKALKEKIISPYEKIYTNGKLILPNPYHPDKPSIFYDFRNNGIVDMKKAIAVSSNIYFYILGGGFENRKGLGINRLYENFTDFGFGEQTEVEYMIEKDGIVPSIEWKKRVFGTNWNIGNTYYASIGQFGFVATPLQIAVAVSAIANEGEVLRPKILKDSEKDVRRKLDFDKKDYEVVKQAMRETALSGTTMSLNLPFVKIASKSGTAERGKNRSRVNSWVMGFFPYDKPKYAFVFLAENGYAGENLNPVSLVSSAFFKKLEEKGLLERLLEH
ncbi:MAG: hypothetical protein KAI16_02255 [Candidatus Pacebacteria bacterium]|nr:hypothetical protein [Candidatus Paceibacterota bacterium]